MYNDVAIAMDQNHYGVINGTFQNVLSHEITKPSHVFVIFDEGTAQERSQMLPVGAFEIMFLEDPRTLTSFQPVTAATISN